MSEWVGECVRSCVRACVVGGNRKENEGSEGGAPRKGAPPRYAAYQEDGGGALIAWDIMEET